MNGLSITTTCSVEKTIGWKQKISGLYETYNLNHYQQVAQCFNADKKLSVFFNTSKRVRNIAT